MDGVAGKKLMILGGNPETGLLVKEANAMGVHTIVVDPNPDAPAKQHALEHYEIDGFDIQSMMELANGNGIDGILVGVADVLVGPYQELCDRLQLPCYASKATVSAFSGKDGFKSACQRFGVRDIPGVLVEHGAELETLEELHLPVMVKPVDSGGGLGMRICRSFDEVRCSIEAGTLHSRRARFLVERLMSGDDIFAYYTFTDGRAYLSAIADRITSRVQGELSPVCLAARYPSRHAKEFLESVHPLLLQMFDGLELRDGILNIQFFLEDGEFHAYDPGFRLQGEAPHIYLNALNGFDHRRMLINFALTGSMGVDNFDQLNDFEFGGKAAGTFWVLLRQGEIGQIRGLDEISADPSVLAVVQRLKAGDRVEPDMMGSERQVLARIYVVSDTFEDLSGKAVEIRSILGVWDSNGDDMVLDWVDPDLLL